MSGKPLPMTVDTKSRHVTARDGNVFFDLGFPPAEAKRLLAGADAQIDDSVRPKKQLMEEIAGWMRERHLTQAAAAEAMRR
jgi:predicted XRE-type DNA-binding protein